MVQGNVAYSPQEDSHFSDDELSSSIEFSSESDESSDYESGNLSDNDDNDGDEDTATNAPSSSLPADSSVNIPQRQFSRYALFILSLYLFFSFPAWILTIVTKINKFLLQKWKRRLGMT